MGSSLSSRWFMKVANMVLVLANAAVATPIYAQPDRFTGTDQPAVHLRLYAGTENEVYQGQLVNLSLEVQLPRKAIAPQVVDLEIPWLGREFGFRWRLPIEQWLCQHAIPTANALACRIYISPSESQTLGLPSQTYNVYAPLSSHAESSSWRLTWQIIIDKPILGNKIAFAPVTLNIPNTGQKVKSNDLAIPVQEPPPPLTLRAACLLPPGQYTVSSHGQSGLTYVGEAIQYCICISGDGALEDISPKQIQDYLTRNLGIPLLYIGETWISAQTRCFRWQFTLSSSGVWQLPPLLFLAFDPRSQETKYQELEIPGIVVTVLPVPSYPRPQAHPEMPHLPLRRIDGLMLNSDRPMGTQQQLLPVALAPPLIWLLLGAWRWYRGAPFTWTRYSRPARQALAALQPQLYSKEPDAFIVWQALQSYISSRFSIRLYRETETLTDILQKRGIDQAFIETFAQLSSRIEKAAFSSTAHLQPADVEELLTLIAELDRRLARMAS